MCPEGMCSCSQGLSYPVAKVRFHGNALYSVSLYPRMRDGEKESSVLRMLLFFPLGFSKYGWYLNEFSKGVCVRVCANYPWISSLYFDFGMYLGIRERSGRYLKKKGY